MNGRFIVGFCVLIIGLALCAAGLWSLLSPVRYQAVVKIKIEPDVVSDVGSPSGDGVYQPYDPYFMETELKIIVSDRVLKSAAQKLSLEEKWVSRYGNGETISNDEAIKRLRRMISLDAERNTIEISVTEEAPDEAAQIANAVAMAYKNYRIDQYQQEMAGGIKMLEEDYQAEEGKIQTMQAQLEELKKQFDATNSTLSLTLTNDLPYVQAKQHLDDTEELHQLLKSKIQEEKAAEDAPKKLVTIVEPAVPPKTPVGPSRLLGTLLLVCGIGLSVLGVHVLRGQGAKFLKPRQTGHED
jgi:uncharacterized protein involved in exopolysaccharide biosynthesis